MFEGLFCRLATWAKRSGAVVKVVLLISISQVNYQFRGVYTLLTSKSMKYSSSPSVLWKTELACT
jgi:hypothetical protein